MSIDPGQSGLLKKLGSVLVSLVILLVIFQAGIFVGYRRGLYYGSERSFAGNDRSQWKHSTLSPFMRDDDDDNPNSVIGTITSVNLPIIIVKSRYDVERYIYFETNTAIRKDGRVGTTSDLKIGETIVAIGMPDSKGQIHTSFIRILAKPNALPPPDATHLRNR